MSDDETIASPGGEDAGPGLEKGSVVGGHEILGELGRGGMGVVYRARHVALDRERALKVIAPDLAGDPDFRRRFERESQLAASVEHPNVVAVHHAGEDGGRLFLSMSLVDGKTLADLVAREGPLAPTRVGAIVAQVAAGLDALHARGLVHRDVKPSNVLIAQEASGDVAFVSDFGLGRLDQDDSGLTSCGDFLGSPDFIAPEQIEGEDLDHRADVYALGGLAHFALTGQAPFEGRSAAAKLVAHSNAPRPEPARVRAGLSADVDREVAKAMAVKPQDRYESAGAFAESLLNVLKRSPQRSRQATLEVVALLAVCVATIVGLLAFGGTEEPPLSDPPRPEKSGRAEAVKTKQFPVGDGPTALTVSGGRVFVASRDAGRVDLVGGSTVALVADGLQPSSVATGFGAAWVVSRDELVQFPLDTGASTSVPLGANTSDVVVSESGVYVGLESDEVVRVDPETLAVTDTFPVADGPRSLAAGDGSIWVACIDAGVVVRIDEAAGRVAGKPIPAGSRPNDLTVGKTGVWVIDNLEGVVRRIDTEAERVVGDPVEVGARPRGVVFDRGNVWVANYEDSTATRIRESSARVIGPPVKVGKGPADITAGAGYVWTADFDGATITRIRP